MKCRNCNGKGKINQDRPTGRTLIRNGRSVPEKQIVIAICGVCAGKGTLR